MVSHPVRSQYKVSWTVPSWPAHKPPGVRVFRHLPLAVDFVARLRRENVGVRISLEEREIASSPWRPLELGGAS
jgi:hypothetical protein